MLRVIVNKCMLHSSIYIYTIRPISLGTFYPTIFFFLIERGGGIKAMEELTSPHDERVNLPRASILEDERRHDDEYAQQVRPSPLQKLVKKYDGSTYT